MNDMFIFSSTHALKHFNQLRLYKLHIVYLMFSLHDPVILNQYVGTLYNICNSLNQTFTFTLLSNITINEGLNKGRTLILGIILHSISIIIRILIFRIILKITNSVNSKFFKKNSVNSKRITIKFKKQRNNQHSKL